MPWLWPPELWRQFHHQPSDGHASAGCPWQASLLNEARAKLEAMIRGICSEHHLKTPRMYRKVAHREYLNLEDTVKTSAAMSIFVSNLFKILGAAQALFWPCCSMRIAPLRDSAGALCRRMIMHKTVHMVSLILAESADSLIIQLTLFIS